MHRLKLLAGTALAVCSLSVPLRGDAQAGAKKAPRGGVEQRIDALTQEMVQAQLHGDPAPYQRYYADDAVIIHATGQIFTKSDEIANLKSGEAKYDAYDVRDKKIYVHGDTAVVELLAAAKGALKGQNFDAEFRVTRVWVRTKGDWKVVLFQTTRVAAPAH